MLKGAVNMEDVVEAKVERCLVCPNCRATTFHPGDYYQLQRRGDAIERVLVATEYRCLNCNKIYQASDLV